MSPGIVRLLWRLLATLLLCAPDVRSQEQAPIPTTSPTNLESPLLRVLNHETRKSLVYVVMQKVNDTNEVMKNLLPTIESCQQNLSGLSTNCLRCVRDRCMDRRYACLSQNVRWMPMDRIVAVYSTRNDVTVCSVIRGSRTCRMIMSPADAVSRSVSVMGDKLVVRFNSASQDLGTSVVLNLADGIQRIANNTDMDPAARWQLERQMQFMADTLRSNLGNMRSQLTRSANMYGDYMRDWGNNFSRQMTDFSTNLRNRLGGMFGPWARRRRKRQAPDNQAPAEQTRNIQREPEPEVACSVIQTDPSQCSTYRRSCSSCDNVTGDLITEACGTSVTDTVTTLDNTLQKLSILYDDILASRNFIDKIDIDVSSADPLTLALKGHNVTVSIGYQTFTFTSTVPLSLLQMTQTANELAEEIWLNWSAGSI